MKLAIGRDFSVDYRLEWVDPNRRLEMVLATVLVLVDHVFSLLLSVMNIYSIYLWLVRVAAVIQQNDSVVDIPFRLVVHTPCSLCWWFLFYTNRFA